jgi:uncharacterized phiE125 gp8 family phage protein
VYSLSLITAPTDEPLTLAEGKKACDLSEDLTEHDTEIESLIAAARERFEAESGRQLVTATWELSIDRFPATCGERWDRQLIPIPKPPLASVSQITYLDTAGDSQTWASSNYRVITKREPGLVELGYGKAWPVTLPVSDAIAIRFVAGYGDATDVPHLVRQGLKLLVRFWFIHPDSRDEIPSAVQSILTGILPGDEFTEYGR